MSNGLRQPVLFIGAGNMATAIATGIQEAQVLPGDLIGACAVRAGPRPGWPLVMDCPSEAIDWLNAAESRAGPGTVVLAVKPQKLPEVAERWPSDFFAGRLLISVLAGVTGRVLSECLSPSCRVIRAMPNTPASVGLGCTAIASSHGASPADLEVARVMFNAVGQTVKLDESLIDAFTGVAGSGPAYVFYLAEAMARGAVEVGLDSADARDIVAQTLLGAATLLARSEDSAAELRARVTSKNGTTHAATSTFDRAGVMDAIRQGVVAARDRGRELSADAARSSNRDD